MDACLWNAGGDVAGAHLGAATATAGASCQMEHNSSTEMELAEGATRKPSVALRFFALGEQPLNAAVALVQQLFDGLRLTHEIIGDDVLLLKQKFVSIPLCPPIIHVSFIGFFMFCPIPQ